MEGIVIVIVLSIAWAILKAIFTSITGIGGDHDSSSGESANAFTVRVKKGLPAKDTGLKVDCYNVEMSGMISHPTDDQVKIILSIQDVTDNDNESDAGAPVLSAHEAFAEKGSRVLGVERLCASGPRHYYPDWTLFVPVPIDFIVPPHKGKRRIKFLLCVADTNTSMERGSLNDTSGLQHVSTDIVNFTFKEPGYMDEIANKDKVEDLTIKLGMCMAAADGSLDQKELNIIKTWAKNLTSLLEDDKAEERNKYFSKFLKNSAIAAKNKKISLSDDYVQARIYVENGKSKEALILLRSIVFSNDSYYSTLSFFYILEKNLITDRKKIMSLFNHILKKNKFDKEIENLIIFKKAIFESSYLDESDLLKTVGPLINNENLWKPHALMLMGDYFLSKKENLKAKEFYLQILDIKNLNKELYSQAKSQLSSIVND